MEQPAKAPRRPISPMIVALLMIGYPIYSIAQLRAFDFPSPRIPLLIALECVGIAAAVGVLVRKYWWVLFAAASGFLGTLLGPPAATGADFSFYATLAVGLLFSFSRNPPVAEEPLLARTKPAPKSQIMPTEDGDLEVLKYRLERERFQWQRASRETENSIINRYFGVIITAIVSIAAIVVSLAQLSISSNNAKAQIDNDKIKNDRQFYLEAARFLLTYEKDLKTQDLERIAYFRDVVVSSFPSDLATQVATTMRDTARNAGARKIWDDGLLYLRSKSPRLP